MSEPTVLSMINDNLNTIAEDQKDIKTSVQRIDKAQAVDSQRLDYLEGDVKDLTTGQKKIKKAMFNHSIDKKVHYNQGYKETFPQRAWRKKGEIGLLTAILTVVSWLINNYFG